MNFKKENEALPGLVECGARISPINNIHISEPIYNFTPRSHEGFGRGRSDPDSPGVRRSIRFFSITECIICHRSFAQSNRPDIKHFVTCCTECSRIYNKLEKSAACRRTFANSQVTETMKQFLTRMHQKYETIANGDN